MQEHLDGATYDGRFIVADAKIGLAGGTDCSRIIVGPTGFGLFSPLPDDRSTLAAEPRASRRRLIFVDRRIEEVSCKVGMLTSPPTSPT
jgi:hypothetical protein